MRSLLCAALGVALGVFGIKYVHAQTIAQKAEPEIKVRVRAGNTLTPRDWAGPFVKSGNPEFQKGEVEVQGFMPAASPEHDQLLLTVYSSPQAEAPRRGSLWRVDLYGRNLVKIAEHTGQRINQASASPDGKYIAYTSRESQAISNGYEVWLVAVKTGAKRKLFTGSRLIGYPFQWRADNSLDVAQYNPAAPAMTTSSSVGAAAPAQTAKPLVPTPSMQWRHFLQDALNQSSQAVSNSAAPPPVFITVAPASDQYFNIGTVPVLSHDAQKTAAFWSMFHLEVKGNQMEWMFPYDKPQAEAKLQWSYDDAYLLVQTQPYSEVLPRQSTRIFRPGTDKIVDVEVKLASDLASRSKMTKSAFAEKKTVIAETAAWVPGSAHRIFIIATVYTVSNTPYNLSADDLESHFFFMDVDNGVVTHVDNLSNKYPNFGDITAWSSDGRYVLMDGGASYPTLFEVN